MATTAMTSRNGTGGGVVRSPNPSGLADVIDLILDKGIVIDAYVRVSLVGIELLTIDARIVVASVDTYLRFAEAVNRLDLQASSKEMTLPELIDDLREGGGKAKSKGVLEGVKDELKELFSSDGDDDEDEDSGGNGASSSRRRSSSGRSSSGRSRSSSKSGAGQRRRTASKSKS